MEEIVTRHPLILGLYGAVVGLGLLLAGRTPSHALPVSESDTALHQARYGVGIGQDAEPAQVTALGLTWYFGGFPSEQALNSRPAGAKATFILPVNPVLDEATLRRIVQSAPGVAWLIGNEGNVPSASAISPAAATDPERYAVALNYYATALRSADASAKLVGPNVLNWSYTCDGCGGFQSGLDWTVAMRAAYVSRYNQEPPFDAWGVHAYDLDWVHLPNGNAALQLRQIADMRRWLDSVPTLVGAPIWVTEIGFHWGYPGIEQRADRLYYPVGAFDYDHAEDWMRTVFGWLDSNAESQHIDKWFLWLTYTNVLEDWMGAWPTVRLLDGPSATATINRLGRLYQELAGADPR